MVKITDYKLRVSQEGKSFYTLTLQGGVEIVRSATGGMYATMRKASLPTTFDEVTCQSLIGSELPGQIVKVECEPYEYTSPDTGEVTILTHRFEYREEAQASQTEFSKIYKQHFNGVK